MPFIKKERRELIDERGLMGLPDVPQPGDECYFYYKRMVDKWKANPRWTTAHYIYRGVLDTPIASNHLAWQVFFQLYVMPYELKKREENGDI